MSKNKKMANIGLIIALVGGLMLPIGVYIFNRYSGKARSENHSEIIKTQGELGNKIDSSKTDIINSIEKKNPSLSEEKTKNMDTRKAEPKNQIVNNAPNEGVQINENNGTVIVPKPLQRNFTFNQAKLILKDCPMDFPIEIWLKGTNPESKNLFNQVVNSVKFLGYNNVSITNIGTYGTTEAIEKDFQYGIENGKFIFSIYPQQ